MRFCLGPDDSGSIEVADDGAALVIIAPAEPSIGVRTFEASTFDAALRMAVDAGLLKAACVEKQILFLDGGQARGADGPAAAPPPRRFRPDLFPKLMSAMSGLLHETQIERGMSAISAASSGRIFKRELSRQRERMDTRRDRFVMLWREVGDALGTSIAGRFDRVDATLRALVAGRNAIDSGETQPGDIVEGYTRANAELLGIGDAALVAYSSPDNRPNALACVVLLYAKEKTGIERARIGAGLAAQAISDDDRRALAALTSARSSYLHVFSATAPRPAERLLDRALASPSYAELTRMEDLLLAGRETEIDVDARGWFTAVSREMDHLGEIGTAALGFVGDI
ncbi:MAG TPA: nitrate- and nitrite sensing domain-containing protein [Polyangia bacterium]|nr:nitrate- and nitrite sensing domain-containing protein [Polyangia bacterium]